MRGAGSGWEEPISRRRETEREVVESHCRVISEYVICHFVLHFAPSSSFLLPSPHPYVDTCSFIFSLHMLSISLSIYTFSFCSLIRVYIGLVSLSLHIHVHAPSFSRATLFSHVAPNSLSLKFLVLSNSSCLSYHGNYTIPHVGFLFDSPTLIHFF